MFCANCGIQQQGNLVFCRACGARVAAVARSQKETSWAWWLLPILLGWAGGLIGWLVHKDSNPSKAKHLLIFGICWSVAQMVLNTLFMILWFGILFLWGA